MGKKIAWISGLVLVIGLVWYLFIKPSDYLIRFKVNALPGTINQTVKLWNKSLPNTQWKEQENLSNFTYEMNHNDSIFIYRWQIDQINDSISKVKVYVSEPRNSLHHKLTVPFSKTPFVRRSEQTVKAVFEELNDHIKRFKVTLVGEVELPSTDCLCIAIKEHQQKKASGMMRNYSYLSGVVAQNNLQANGSPFVEVTDWQMEKDSIAFNFCNPIVKKDSMPEIKGLFYKQIESKKALKAIYNGNYITSDRAWYQLLDHSEKNGIAVENRPFEIFNSNPNFGGDELQWEAEVFMPLRSADE